MLWCFGTGGGAPYCKSSGRESGNFALLLRPMQAKALAGARGGTITSAGLAPVVTKRSVPGNQPTLSLDIDDCHQWMHAFAYNPLFTGRVPGGWEVGKKTGYKGARGTASAGNLPIDS